MTPSAPAKEGGRWGFHRLGLGAAALLLGGLVAVTALIAGIFSAQPRPVHDASASPTLTVDGTWAGLAETRGGPFMSVSASWRVPAVTPKTHSVTGQLSDWIGIGGYGRHSRLVQVGTVSYRYEGKPGYHTFWEVWPGGRIGVNHIATIGSGNLVRASISRLRTGRWRVVFADLTERWRTHYTVRFPDAADSAEWMTEYPLQRSGPVLVDGPFPRVRPVTFTRMEANGQPPQPTRSTSVQAIGEKMTLTPYCTFGSDKVTVAES